MLTMVIRHSELDRNRITAIVPALFARMPHLASLYATRPFCGRLLNGCSDLSANEISFIDPQAFAMQSTLTELFGPSDRHAWLTLPRNLSSNAALTYLPNQLFATTTALMQLLVV